MADNFVDVDESAVKRPSRVWRTMQKLLKKEQNSEVEELRYFLLYLSLECYADCVAVCGPSSRTLYDLTGSAGCNIVAASLLQRWERCVSLELTSEERCNAEELIETSRRRLERRWTRRSARASCTLNKVSSPTFQVLDSHRLWSSDWKDADFAIFDASRFAQYIDQGVIITQILRQGIANAIPGTYLLLITSDQYDPDHDRWGLLNEEPQNMCCVLVDSYLMTSSKSSFLLRGDLLRILGHSADRRVTVHPISSSPSTFSSVEDSTASRIKVADDDETEEEEFKKEVRRSSGRRRSSIHHI
mmetsp:Transcript_19228/g.29157  ORF Transcript_19228/g.29157 Transcript_19228/m.29157 type:complete len:302 (-) Transcript_19228:24-929(-)